MKELVQHIFNPENGLTNEKTYERGELITKTGAIENHIYFILSGAVRAIYRSINEEHTIRLGYTNSVITSLPSFFESSPSLFDLEVIRNTKVICVSKIDYFDCISQSEDLTKAHHKLIENLISQQIERELDLLTSSPKERLNRLLKRSPQVFQEIPNKYIAQYLRMSPETLSRLKS